MHLFNQDAEFLTHDIRKLQRISRIKQDDRYDSDVIRLTYAVNLPSRLLLIILLLFPTNPTQHTSQSYPISLPV